MCKEKLFEFLSSPTQLIVCVADLLLAPAIVKSAVRHSGVRTLGWYCAGKTSNGNAEQYRYGQQQNFVVGEGGEGEELDRKGSLREGSRPGGGGQSRRWKNWVVRFSYGQIVCVWVYTPSLNIWYFMEARTCSKAFGSKLLTDEMKVGVHILSIYALN